LEVTAEGEAPHKAFELGDSMGDENEEVVESEQDIEIKLFRGEL